MSEKNITLLNFAHQYKLGRSNRLKFILEGSSKNITLRQARRERFLYYHLVASALSPSNQARNQFLNVLSNL